MCFRTMNLNSKNIHQVFLFPLKYCDLVFQIVPLRRQPVDFYASIVDGLPI